MEQGLTPLENQQVEKMKFLQETIWRCLNKAPVLEAKDLALVLAWELDSEELVEFVRFFKKELTKDENGVGA